MKFGSICSGIEAASVAFKPLGWEAEWFSEIEPFPCAVLAHHYPDVPNLGDMTKIYDKRDFTERAVDLICGGTPCQAFSVAGLRQGLADARGNLSLEFCRSVHAKRPRWVLWENVPGVLSSKDNAFGCFLAELSGCNAPLLPGTRDGRWAKSGIVSGQKYGLAWRVLDAQYFGVPQRRRRVFVVGYSGNLERWSNEIPICDRVRFSLISAQVLFECEGLYGDFKKGGKKGTGGAADVGFCVTAHGGRRLDPTVGTLVPVTAHGQGGAEIREGQSPTLSCNHEAPIAFTQNQAGDLLIGDVCGCDVYNHAITGDIAATLGSNSGAGNTAGPKVLGCGIVRRLTPVECERLQGFPDNYTRIPWRKAKAEDCPDGPRYRAIGNSWAVPCAAWIAKRIQEVDDALKTTPASAGKEVI